jgi:hypothetical protein
MEALGLVETGSYHEFKNCNIVLAIDVRSQAEEK